MGRQPHALALALSVACSASPPATPETPAGTTTDAPAEARGKAAEAPGPPADPPGSVPAEARFPILDDDLDAVFSAEVLNLSERTALAVVDVPVAPYRTQMVVLRTDDAGRAWERVLAVDSTFGTWAHHEGQVWLASHIQRAGLTPELRHSADGGRTWRSVDVEEAVSGSGSMVRYADLRISGDGVDLARDGTWLHSEDAGASWEPIEAPPDVTGQARRTPCRAITTDETVRIERAEGDDWQTVAELARFRP